jgi:sulfofructose kinase
MSHATTSDRPVVICVGQAVMDHRFSVATIPSSPQKYLANHYDALPGGMATGAAITAARLGAQVFLATRLGDDPSAAALSTILAQESIDLSLTQRAPGCRTAVSAITVDPNGERQIVHATTDAFERGAALIPEQLPKANALLVDPRWPAASLAALQWARHHDIPSVLDADIAPPDVLQTLVPQADWVVFSIDGLAQLFSSDANKPHANNTITAQLQAVAAMGPSQVAVTCGDHGVIWIDHHVVHETKAINVNAVDTTGAGDVFHGAIAFALAACHQRQQGPNTYQRAEIFEFANHIAAHKVAAGQGILGAPTAAQAHAALQRLTAAIS